MAAKRNQPRQEIGKEIDWSKVIPSITRPVWEPPALVEVLDYFEDIDPDEFTQLVPDPAIRSQLLELTGELIALLNYSDWADQTWEAAKEIADRPRAKYYRGLRRALRVDMVTVYLDYVGLFLKHKELFDVTRPWYGYLLAAMDPVFEQRSAMDIPGSESSSTTSYATANDESDGHPDEEDESDDLSDLNLPHTDVADEANEPAVIPESTAVNVSGGVLIDPRRRGRRASI